MTSMNEYRLTLIRRATDDITDLGVHIAFTLSEPDTSKNFIRCLKTIIFSIRS